MNIGKFLLHEDTLKKILNVDFHSAITDIKLNQETGEITVIVRSDKLEDAWGHQGSGDVRRKLVMSNLIEFDGKEYVAFEQE